MLDNMFKKDMKKKKRENDSESKISNSKNNICEGSKHIQIVNSNFDIDKKRTRTNSQR